MTLSRFYFPKGRPVPRSEIELVIERVRAAFNQLADGRAKLENMQSIMSVGVCPFSIYPFLRRLISF